MSSGFDKDSLTAWISQGFEHLVERVRSKPNDVHFDILIVGSGYGGAIAAATFAGRQHGSSAVAVGILERGKEYLPGSFPTGLAELPRHIRREQNKEGLFDIRLGAKVTTVTASGVGGGSLINAGVMEVPLPEVFQNGWPGSLSNLSAWRQYFDRAAELLGARVNGAHNTIVTHEDGPPQKFQSIKAMAPGNAFRPAAITVAMADSASSGNVELKKCKLCGDCATGCNLGAKNSLDVNLLVSAHQKDAEIFSGATVLDIEPDGSNWIVNAVYTNATLRKRDKDVLRIRARRVVLAAGTLGSSEILLRSHAKGLPLAATHLGQHCSTNGDMLVTDYATRTRVNTVANETIKPSTRAIGPTITGIIDLRRTAGVLIEEMSVPAGLRLAFAEVFATVNTLHGLDEIDWSNHGQGFPVDDHSVPSERITNSALYAIMGDDGAKGAIVLDGQASVERDGISRMHWEDLPDLPLFDRQVDALAALTTNSGGRLIPNPVWKLLPPKLGWLLENKRGPLVTVHPLGGCAMADSAEAGVVDNLGRVFSGSNSTALHDGLVVLDGSIIPTALATNPALTIAATALRAAEALAEAWGLDPAPAAGATAPFARPTYRKTDVAASPSATEVEIIERLVGPLSLQPKGHATKTYVVELTLRFAPKPIANLLPGDNGDATLAVSGDQSDPLARSEIRIFPQKEWQELEHNWGAAGTREEELDAIAEFRAPLTGSLKVLWRNDTSALGRIWRAGKAYLLNRGLRDIYQALADGDGGSGLFSRIRGGIAVASRSGAVRCFAYNLQIGVPDAESKIELDGDRIVGTKTFTYNRRCNPWRQLMELKLDRFPGGAGVEEQVLSLDLGYLARIGIPLFRITSQRDGVSALGEMAAFFCYFLRLLLSHHIWSFRAPDKDVDPANDVINFRPPARLVLPGGSSVAAQTIVLPMLPEKPDLGDVPVPGEILITRYPQPNGTSKRPVVLLHGYSAGGTTFAHHAVNPNLASHLWQTGRDVWIADLRTSPAHPTANRAWSFDQIGRRDVPKVIDLAAQASFDGKVDVVAHCMGTIVFSIAALSNKLAGKVNRVAFTQVGPLVVFTPANIFRAYAMRYLQDFLGDSYEFNPTDPTLADDLLDRVLSTLPYPVEEFDIENPLLPWKRTPWTRTRHRMDALYGRDFNVANMEPEMLRFIDEHFGALSLRTVATTLHFVRYALMTNHRGDNDLVSRSNFEAYWDFPTFSVHGEKTGLTHRSTVNRMEKILGDAGRVYIQPFINPGAGHQDALIGTTRHATFAQITQFLDAQIPRQPSPADTEFSVHPPWIGPILTEEWSMGGQATPPCLVIRVGSMPSHKRTEGVIMLRVQVVGDEIRRPDGQPWTEEYIVSHMVYYTSSRLRNERWDAFEAPLPKAMPGHDPNNPGNALLTLLVYAEDAALQAGMERIYLYSIADRIFPLNLFDANIGQQTENLSLAAERFRRFAETAMTSLVLPQGRVDPGILTRRLPEDRAVPPPRRLHYRGARARKSFRLDSATKTVVEESRETMDFGQNPAIGHATLGRLVEGGRDLLDGVVPYDPPDNAEPVPREQGTSFSMSSCQYPAGFFDAPVAHASYRRIGERLQAEAGAKPRFALFVGDQVYVDPTAGLYDPAQADDRYRLPYEAWLRASPVRDVLRRIPSFMLLDDHEITDNWEPVRNPDTNENKDLQTRGLAAFQKYQRGMKADFETFQFDGFHFFMLDTRTKRDYRQVGQLNGAKLFPTATMGRLKQWLSEKSGPKFVVSPVIFLPRHRRAVQRDARLDPVNLSAIYSDGWDGYPDSLREVLGHIAKNAIGEVVFLSGDEHRGCVATMELFDAAGQQVAKVHSIHTSAMYAPFPFANSVDEEAVDKETIEFSYGGQDYRCKVDTQRPPAGDGAVFLNVTKAFAGWKIECNFAGGRLGITL